MLDPGMGTWEVGFVEVKGQNWGEVLMKERISCVEFVG